MYKYKIHATTDCNGQTVPSNYVNDIGFTIPYGIANGHVEYEGGNPVDSVEVLFEQQNGTNGNSLYFDGEGDYVNIDGYKGILGTNPRTVEAWIKVPEDVIIKNNAIVSNVFLVFILLFDLN